MIQYCSRPLKQISGSLLLSFWAQLSSAMCSKYMTCIELLPQQAVAIIHFTMQSPQNLKVWSTWYIKYFWNTTFYKRAQPSKLCTPPFINYSSQRHFSSPLPLFHLDTILKQNMVKNLKCCVRYKPTVFSVIEDFPFNSHYNLCPMSPAFVWSLLLIIQGLTQWVENQLFIKWEQSLDSVTLLSVTRASALMPCNLKITKLILLEIKNRFCHVKPKLCMA